MTKFPADRQTSSARDPARHRPRDYASRREQLRLFMLCALLMLVLVMMNEARKPSTWKWMWGGAPAEKVESAMNTRVNDAPAELPVDGFSVPSPSLAHTDQGPPANKSQHRLPEITDELLAPIEDNAVLRARENPAWLAMFKILGERSAAEIESLSTAEVGFSQLFRQTNVYRGRLVTIQGTLYRLDTVEPRPNDVGIESLYRWILQPKGGSNLPVVVYSLQKPEGLEPGSMREPCRLTGFVFKRWAYNAADGPRIAPLLLAKTIRWSPAPPVAPVKIPSLPVLLAITLVFVILAAALALAVHRSTVRRRPEIEQVREAQAAPQLDIDEQEVLPPVGETLRALAEKDR